MGEIVFTKVSFNFFTESVSCNDCQPLIERDVGRLSAIYPRSSDPFYIVSYYIKWVTTSWTHSTQELVGVIALSQLNKYIPVIHSLTQSHSYLEA